MIIQKSSEVEKSMLVNDGVKEVWIQWLIGEKSGPSGSGYFRFIREMK